MNCTTLKRFAVAAFVFVLVFVAPPSVPFVHAQTATATLNIVPGWNLVGMGSSGNLEVASAFGDASKVATVWKWLPSKSGWGFYAPSMAGQQLTDYATSKGYEVLTTISGGEGYWINAKTSFTAQMPSGTTLSSASFRTTLLPGWNLITTGDSPTAREFNRALSASPPLAGVIPENVIALWAWSATQANWFFYAPSLDAAGGTVLSDYIKSKGYLDFEPKARATEPGGPVYVPPQPLRLFPTMGFWTNMPPPSIQLSTLAAMTAMPFTSLTISGTGLTQATSGVSVRFIPENGNPAIIVPVSAPSSTTLKVMVPPLFDPASGSSISGVVDVQVIQNSGTTLLTSNVIRGLRIAALPPVPTGTPMGSRTAAFLNATSDIFDSTQSLSSDSTLSQIATVAPNYRSDISALISAINAITSGQSTSVGFTAANGSTITLDATTLALSDQMIQGLVAELASKTQVPATVAAFDAMRNWLTATLEAVLNWFIPPSFAQVSNECPLFPNDPIAYDTNLCHVKRFFRNLTPGEDPAIRAAMIDAGANLAAGMLFAPVSFAHQVIAGAVWTFSYALVKTGAPPPGGDVVEGMTTTSLDALANSNGLIGFAADAFKVFRLAATTFPSHKGVPPAMTVSDAAGNAYLLMRDGTRLVQVPTTQGSFPVDSLTLVVFATTTTSTTTSTTTASTTTTTVATAYCACRFDVYVNGGTWFCQNTNTWYSEGGYLMSYGACRCGPELYTVCQ